MPMLCATNSDAAAAAGGDASRFDFLVGAVKK